MSVNELLPTVVTLALLLAVGYVGGRVGVVNEVSTERLSALILKIGQPFLIINALISQKFSPENLKTGLTILLLGICMHAVMAGIAYLLAKPIKKPDEHKLSEYCMFFANCGFIGFPILESIFGDFGLFCGAFYVISFHLFVWSLGIKIFARGRDDIKITPRKMLLNFGTVPSIIGFLIFISGVTLPSPVYSLASSLNSMCTPIALIISGANLSRRSLRVMFKNPAVYYTNAVKLLIMPILMSTMLWLCGLPDYMIVFGAVMAAMPCAAVVTMFGETYNVSPGFAAELVGSSSLLCVLTIFPAVSYANFLTGL